MRIGGLDWWGARAWPERVHGDTWPGRIPVRGGKQGSMHGEKTRQMHECMEKRQMHACMDALTAHSTSPPSHPAIVHERQHQQCGPALPWNP